MSGSAQDPESRLRFWLCHGIASDYLGVADHVKVAAEGVAKARGTAGDGVLEATDEEQGQDAGVLQFSGVRVKLGQRLQGKSG